LVLEVDTVPWHRSSEISKVVCLVPATFEERVTIISQNRQGHTILTRGSIGSTFTCNGVCDLPRPPDDSPVPGVRGVANPGVNGVAEEGGPIELFLLIGVICHELTIVSRTYRGH
jgi:hypothetical protein